MRTNNYTGEIRINDEYYDPEKMMIVHGYEVQMQRSRDYNWEPIRRAESFEEAKHYAIHLTKQFDHPVVYGPDGYGIQF